jgi:lipid-binding SYLF domain-containing protein
MAPAPSSPSSRASACSGKTNPQQQQQQQSSPTSILQQWRDDARGAMEDAYANYVLGDDAGESARLVLVATPAEDVLQEGGGLDDHRRKAAPHTRKQQTLTRHSHRHSSPISSPSLIMAVNSRKPCSSFHSCGVTFVEINGRAYVAGLTTDSAAYQAGVLPEDCVQYAAVLAKEWEAPLDDDFAAISHQALEREDKGQRITFGELKRVFLHGSGLLHNDAPHGVDMTMMGPNSSRTDVPTTIRIGKGPMTNPCGPSTLADTSFRRDDMDENDSDDDLLNPHHGKRRKKKPTPLSDDQPRPVVLVFRRTRQRPPRAWNFWPNYRLDDECDVACQILESLTTTTVFNGHARQHTSADDDDTNVEASAIRGMIQKAVGLAFVRSNKVVFGLSLAGGSGIVISKLSDGTWSAPSCIGMMGVGLGLQVGLEVANYIFILQTKEALEHFQRGGSFTLGANVGAAFAGMGREAVGAASVSSALCGMSSSVQAVKEDEYTFEDGGADGRPPGMKSSGVGRDGLMGGSVAPIVAYAKSEGLYVGVSLEGSRIFTREELNARAYKFSSYNHKAVSAQDILTGKIQQRPVEAENLYALLHSIEYTHEVSCLPALPRSKFLVDKSKRKEVEWSKPWDASSPPYIKNEDGEVASAIDDDDDDDDDVDRVLMQDDIDDFNERFQEFLFGGVTVQRIAPHKREKRTLWLFAPQDHSLRLGFVSKLFSATSRTTHLSASIIQDISPKASNMGGNNSTVSDMEGDEVTLDSALMVRFQHRFLGFRLVVPFLTFLI